MTLSTKTKPATHVESIDVSGSDATFSPPLRAVYAGGAGNIVLIAAEDSSTVTLPVGDFTLLPIEVKEIKSSGTTATDLFGLR